jgi:hypothetical protein
VHDESVSNNIQKITMKALTDCAGMGLRDYFAAKAMQAMIGNCEGSNFDDFVIAQEAYQMADFMMTERESHGKQSQ